MNRPNRIVSWPLVILAFATGCSREPEAQAFGSAMPEQGRNISYVAGGQCHLDVVSGTLTPRGWRTNTDKATWISGWAYDDPARPPSEWVVVELAAPGDRARYFAVSTLRKPNAELAARFGDTPAARNAAFELVARADALPRGRYAIRVLMKGSSGGLRCETGRVLELL